MLQRHAVASWWSSGPSAGAAGHVPRRTSMAPVEGPKRRVTVLDLKQRHQKGVPIVMVTAYDYSSAALVEASDAVDVVLVGDSAGMGMTGYDTTLPVTMDEMMLHCKSVAAGLQRPMLVGDMPFGSYEVCKEDAVRNAIRFVKEGKCDAVKLEGGVRVLPQVQSIITAGVPVMGHIGLTPQAINTMGGFRVQGKTAEAATRLLEDARVLEKAGCFSIVIEGVPDRVAELISKSVSVPTIGIGAGNKTGGQVLVWQDMFGTFPRLKPKFCKRFRDLGPLIKEGLQQYKREVTSRAFPAKENCYVMSDEEWDKLCESMGLPKSPAKPKPTRRTASDTLPKEPVVVIIGGGAIGSLLAATMATAKDGAKYTPKVYILSAWQEHNDAINADGLKIEEPDGTSRVLKNVRATADVNEILEQIDGRCDLVIVAEKSPRTAEAAAKAKTLLDSCGGIVATVQNGLGNAEKLHSFVGKDNVLQGTISHGAEIVTPGVVKHTGIGDAYLAAKKGSLNRELTEGIAAMFSEHGIACRVVDDASQLLWKKLLVNAAINPLTALTGMRNGELLASAGGMRLVNDIADEAAAVANARGIQFAFDPHQAVAEVLRNTSANRSSMLQDVVRGTPTEVDAISGALVREGKAHGVATPLCEAIATALDSPSVIAELPKLQPLFREFLVRADE
eukprot:m51a1_g10993 putative fused 3-methyl-2-oxobutanoate hydroxymethyltransferase + 2-dehydropantoate 2-reductase (675) ;mRNA; r:335352-337784